MLFNTPITFPIAWNNSKVDGVSGRLSTINLHGFQAYMTLGHTRARYFPPETGGLIALGGIPTGVFRIDHDQAYQQNVNLRYQRHKNEEWIDFTWRFDSGLVVSGVPDVAAALDADALPASGHRIYVQWSSGHSWSADPDLQRRRNFHVADVCRRPEPKMTTTIRIG